AVRHRRARRSSVRGDQIQARHQARARRYVRLSPALLRWLRLGRGSEGGEFAVKQAIWGAGDGSVAIRRIGNYSSDYALVKLAKVGGKTKVLADAFIAPSGSDVTPAFEEYL